MRIIGGRNRGRRLTLPDEAYTRPTTDRVREAIFNILMHYPDVKLQGSRVLDGFAGSGAMGLEALSRGAMHVTFVEQQARVAKVLQHNIDVLAEKSQVNLIHGDLLKIKMASQPMDLVFLDPPYGKGLEFTAIPYLQKQGWTSQDTIIIYETDVRTDLTPLLSLVDIIDERAYGSIKICFLRPHNT
ncbi:MAG: 16S rRNA (guanine(966)-N(2))-methyltransferase RsmD [Candidatus Paracaedibacteraceae bacterium]|nr:16S rRNA (guanine(966)-N(2))-methyltransferase RsmD [Candidatus Paracaedibacteraceae bacterium]